MLKKRAVTGAFGFSGQYITRKLLEKGAEVITLTRSTERENLFGEKVKAFPHNFDNPDLLVETLYGVDVLYNTYWVRFNHKLFNFSDAITKNKILFHAAKKAGVKRVIHLSVSNASLNSHLEYFRGKAECELALKNSGLSYAIVRPTVIFGDEDILINNIAWMIRHLPVIGMFGDGQYRLQPIFVEDLAELTIKLSDSVENVTIDAIGPETFTFEQLLERIMHTLGICKPIVSVSPSVGYLALNILGKIIGDIILTRAEIEGLMSDLLFVKSPPVGKTQLTDWMHRNRDWLGQNYAYEIKRRTDRKKSYRELSG